jgi:hypothetical protein
VLTAPHTVQAGPRSPKASQSQLPRGQSCHRVPYFASCLPPLLHVVLTGFWLPAPVGHAWHWPVAVAETEAVATTSFMHDPSKGRATAAVAAAAASAATSNAQPKPPAGKAAKPPAGDPAWFGFDTSQAVKLEELTASKARAAQRGNNGKSNGRLPC